MVNSNTLSSRLISPEKFVLIIDEIRHENVALQTVTRLLEEQGQKDSIRILNFSGGNVSSKSFLSNLTDVVNIVLPPLSIISLYLPKISGLFQIIENLKRHKNVKQIFLWSSADYLFDKFILQCLEHMADIVVYIENKSDLSIRIRKEGGSVTKKRFNYTITKDSFVVEDAKRNETQPEKADVYPGRLGTFKIELEEDELVARNALRLPYERTTEEESIEGGNIIYTPEKDDDFDEEDPDDDLCI